MGIFSSVVEFSPTGTVIATGTTNSNSILTAATRHGQAMVKVATKVGDTLDIAVQASDNNSDFYTVASFNQIIATGNYGLALDEDKLGKYTRLQYVAAGGGWTFGAKMVKKQGT